MNLHRVLPAEGVPLRPPLPPWPMGVDKKWPLLPSFLRSKGLVRQHIESYNYFVSEEIKQIVKSPGNKVIKCEADPNFYIDFENVSVGRPTSDEDMVSRRLTPAECRSRDINYTAPILVDVVYYRGKPHRQKNVEIGRLPVMLRSQICVLHNKTQEELVKLGECPLDPGGYFILKGTEK